jgi:hypothetical protein
MKKIIVMAGLLSFLSGCSWLHHEDTNWGYSEGSISGSDYSPARGTTGVSSGADAGVEITGSNAAPPR